MIISNIEFILTGIALLFFIGVIGVVLNRKNIIVTIMSLELMLLAVNLNFITFSVAMDDLIGQIFVFFVLTIAATETSIGLALLTVHYKLKNTIKTNKIKNIRP